MKLFHTSKQAGIVAIATFGTAITVAIPATAAQAPSIYLDPQAVPARTEIAVVYDNGAITETPNAHEPRAAMSLAKLFLGYWVANHGAPGDAMQVETMIRFSDDGIATRLDRTYPQAISEVIASFGLEESSYNG